MDIKNNKSSNKKKGRRISEVMQIYSQMNKLNIKGKNEIENVLINNQESISYNNINILKSDLPNIINDLSQIDNRNNIKVSTSNVIERKNHSNYSRNLKYLNHSYGDSNHLDNNNFNTTMKLRRLTQNKKNKYNNNDDNSMNITQLVWRKSKNMGFMGSKNKNSRNIDYIYDNNNNYLTNNNNINNVNSFNTKDNNEKMKFTINKSNLMNTIKKPSKIKMEKKNLKYKIPIEFMNNLDSKKKIMLDYSRELNNKRKINLKQRDINNNRALSNITPIKKNKNIAQYQNENDENESNSFIESTLVDFNGLVSRAQKLGQILIDNKEMINANKKNDLLNNTLKNSIEILNVEKKMDKLDNKIKNEHKTVEKLQKINIDLNNKINLFNENSQQYENKVKELVNVINQFKQNNNNGSNNNINNSNGDNIYNMIGKKNISRVESINKFIPSNQKNNFILQGKPKKKKIKFGFVESIFMKPDKFQIINLKKNNNVNQSINKDKKEPKLIFVNMNRNNDNNKNKDLKISMDEYKDAAAQMANQLIIESLISIENEDEES